MKRNDCREGQQRRGLADPHTDAALFEQHKKAFQIPVHIRRHTIPCSDSVQVSYFDRSAPFGTRVPSMRCRLKKLYRIPEWIIEDDLLCSYAGDHLIAKLEPRRAKPLDFFGKIGHGYLDAIPPTGNSLTAIGHGPAARTSRTAEKQAQGAARNRGKGRQSFGFNSKTEMTRVETDCNTHVIDHVAHSCPGLIHSVISPARTKLRVVRLPLL